MAYDPIPHIEQTVGHLTARRAEVLANLSAGEPPAYDVGQVLGLPVEPDHHESEAHEDDGESGTDAG